MEFPSSPQRVLVIQTGEVRDVVASLPFLALLRMRLPRAEIACLASERIGTFLYSHGTSDRIIAVREFWNRSYREATFLSRHLAAFDAEVAFDLEASFRSGLLTWMSRARFRVGVKGASLGGRVAYTNPIATAATDLVSRHLDLLSVLDVEGGSRALDLPEQEHDRRWAAERHWQLGLADDFVIVPVKEVTRTGAASVTWQPSEYTSLIHFLKSQWNLPVVLLPENAAAVSLAETIAAITRATLLTKSALAFGEATSLIRRCTAVIGPETELAYLAAATQMPTVVASPNTASASVAGYVPFEAEQFFAVPMLQTGALNTERFLDTCDNCLTAISLSRNEVASSPRRNAA